MKRGVRTMLRPAIAAAALVLAGTAAILASQAVGCDPSEVFTQMVCKASDEPAPVPSPTFQLNRVMTAISIEIPEGADCTGCHMQKDGTLGTNPIPKVGHPVQGWADCTQCHTAARLVETAPGHTGIHKEQCLVCHQGETPLPVSRPHPPTRNTGCLECHGKTEKLPQDMSHRVDTTCWLCHRTTQQ
jgi:hypothetical protein